jgi:Fe-S-cluster containining protein
VANRTPDCRTCGICCSATADAPDAFVDVTKDDLQVLGVKRVRRLVVIDMDPRSTTGISLQVKQNRQGKFVCAALRGSIGGEGRCGCSIYQHRPEVCREFKVGSTACLTMRREYEEKTGRKLP